MVERLVRAYYDTLKDGMASFDEDRLRAILAPDLASEGPIVGYVPGAERFIRSLSGFAAAMRGLNMLQQVWAGGQAAALCDAQMLDWLFVSPSSSKSRRAQFCPSDCSAPLASIAQVAAAEAVVRAGGGLIELIPGTTQVRSGAAMGPEGKAEWQVLAWYPPVSIAVRDHPGTSPVGRPRPLAQVFEYHPSLG
jgi:hypothetical protein